MQDIELNPQFAKALELINLGKNVFITGKAGTGKSTLLSYFRANTKKNLAVIAPTGVAAVNIKGQTIHSFFKFRPDITVEKVKRGYKGKGRKGFYKKLDLIIIDEISMVRADLLDCVNELLMMHGKNKNLPFGGIQMVFIGDLYQLPPVVTSNDRDIFRFDYDTPYFFSSHVMEHMNLEFTELEKIYRQKDQGFIDILNSVRNRSITQNHLEKLNKRYLPNFDSETDFYIYLTTTNAKAATINDEKLYKLQNKLHSYEGRLTGQFDQKSAPTNIIINLKVGSQVMLVNNDQQGRWVNGTIGKIVKIEKEEPGDVIFVELTDGEVVDVVQHTWEMFKFIYNESSRKVESETTGTFTQYPIILAWAITIHKSQGKTFEKVIVDMDRGAFAHGQTYVALSRCVSLEGLVLKKPIKLSHILLDWKVVSFLTEFQYQKSEAILSSDKKTQIFSSAIKNKTRLEITYLKSNDEKSTRTISPQKVGEMDYLGKKFLGVRGYDELRQEDRVFRVDRILEINSIS